MSATVAAALKKITTAILSNPKVLKTIVGIVLGIIIIFMTPIIAVIAVFNGDIEFDRAELATLVEQNMSAQQMAEFQLMNDTMAEVEEKLSDKKLSDYNTHAEVIYFFVLYEKSEDENFVKDFVACFKKNQSDEDLINAVNQKFGTQIIYDDFNSIMMSIKGAEIGDLKFIDAGKLNNLDLVKWCKNAEKKGWGYVYGGYGQICTNAFLDQQAISYPANNEAGGEMREVGEKWLGKRVVDCIGLIKSYAWYDSDSGEIYYGSNGFTDCGANSIWDGVTESGDISTIPEIPGVAVWMNGHIGVYIGDGKVIEAQGTYYGVVKTDLQGRGWTKWLKIPNIKYIEEQENTK